MKPSDKGSKKAYETPTLVALGSLHESTLHGHVKTGAHCDVSCFHHGSG